MAKINVVTETMESIKSLLQERIKVIMSGQEQGIGVRLDVNLEKGVNVKDLILPCFLMEQLNGIPNRQRDPNIKKIYGDRDDAGNMKEYDFPVPVDLVGELQALATDVSTIDRLLVEMIRIARETKEIPVYYDKAPDEEKYDNFPIFWGEPAIYPSGDVHWRGFPFKVWAWVGTIRYVTRKIVLNYDVGGILVPGGEHYRQYEGQSSLVQI